MTRCRRTRTPMGPLAVAAALATLVGCGDKDAPVREPAPASGTPTAVVSKELVGTWTARLARVDAAELPGGRYTMRLSAEGTAAIYFPGSDRALDCVTQRLCQEVSIAAGGGRLTIGDTTGCVGSAQYAYNLADGRLTTRRVKEECGQDRPLIFHRTTWRRQP
jgi:hypothetical protein